MDIIGRADELEELRDCHESGKPEFLVIYGRWRVGKTYLVKQFFQENFDFYATAILEANLRQQLRVFADSLVEYSGVEQPTPKDWFEAFSQLKMYLQSKIEENPKMRLVVFLDELPWFASRKSSFLAALDHFWNSWASSCPQMLLVACGSATSWIVKNIILNKGGLHNRTTREIKLKPFTLAECEQLLKQNGVIMTRYQIIELYMIFGGIPYYLERIRPQYSLAQNINRLCFKDGAALVNEFQALYHSLFTNAEKHVSIVMALSKKKKGLTLSEISEASGLSKGGALTLVLQELEQCDFIRSYKPFARKKRGRLYQLADPFSLFHLNFIIEADNNDELFWLKYIEGDSHHAWTGFAFEQVCLWHQQQIKKALGIGGVLTQVSSWRSESSDPGAQIDLVIKRNDGVINLCEMKYTIAEFLINKSYDANLRNKRASFIRETRTKLAVHTTLVTTYGLVRNEFANNIQSVVVADDLFA